MMVLDVRSVQVIADGEGHLINPSYLPRSSGCPGGGHADRQPLTLARSAGATALAVARAALSIFVRFAAYGLTDLIAALTRSTSTRGRWSARHYVAGEGGLLRVHSAIGRSVLLCADETATDCRQHDGPGGRRWSTSIDAPFTTTDLLRRRVRRLAARGYWQTEGGEVVASALVSVEGC
ncbi:MAG: hypothetical protein H6719_25870 [Sandaracinaceae bacterium]|nr:hypothetical protein [Sandaracinaceae bacterium]